MRQETEELVRALLTCSEKIAALIEVLRAGEDRPSDRPLGVIEGGEVDEAAAPEQEHRAPEQEQNAEVEVFQTGKVLEMPPTRLKVLQDRLVAIIDEHETELASSIRDMGCGGDCYRCPHPDFPNVLQQVQSCLTSVVDGLELDAALKE